MLVGYLLSENNTMVVYDVMFDMDDFFNFYFIIIRVWNMWWLTIS